jgi:hypothetical protein
MEKSEIALQLALKVLDITKSISIMPDVNVVKKVIDLYQQFLSNLPDQSQNPGE